MTLYLEIRVPGEPRPQKKTKTRAFYNPKLKRWIGQIYDPKGDTADYRAKVTHEAALTMQETGLREVVRCALGIKIRFFVSKPKSKSKKVIWPAVAPDWENYVKACQDALQGVVFHDDAQICQAFVEKRYAVDCLPQTMIEIWELNENEGKEVSHD
jgi:Holliday junction resolvase RusA-like endonuclease